MTNTIREHVDCPHAFMNFPISLFPSPIVEALTDRGSVAETPEITAKDELNRLNQHQIRMRVEPTSVHLFRPEEWLVSPNRERR